MAEEKDNEEEPLIPEESEEEDTDKEENKDDEFLEGDENNEDEDENEDGEEEEGDNKTTLELKKKKILLILTPIVIAIIVFVLFYIFVLKGKKEKEIEGLKTQMEDLAKQPGVKNTYLDLELMTMSLLPSSSGTKHMRIGITMRINSEEERELIISKEPILKDSILTFLRSLRAEDFNSSRSTLFLKEELMKRVNKITSPVEIKEILFREIVIK